MPLLDNLHATLKADIDVGKMKTYFTEYINQEVKIGVQTAMKDLVEEMVNNRTNKVKDSIRTMFKDLTDRLSMVKSQHSALDKRVEDVTQNCKTYGNTIKSLEKDIEGHSTWNERLKEIGQQVNRAKDGVDILKKEISRLSILDKNVDDIREQFNLLNGTMANINKFISFSVRVKKSIANIAPEATVVFDSIITNNGNGYNSNSGIFKAPVSGTYFFTSTILTKSPSILEIELRVNGITQMSMYTNAQNLGHNNAVNSLIIKLKAGDEVKLVKNKFGFRPFYIHHYYSTFSGFVLHADVK